MKDILDAVAQALADQATALGEIAEQVTGLKQTLARQFSQVADELKGQIAADQEKDRKSLYELQVSLAKLRESISALPDANPESKQEPGKPPSST